MSFGIGLIGMEFATIFTNALLPGLAPREEIGRLSGSGFAFGYLGGVVALALMLLFFAEDAQSGLTLLGIPPLFGLDPALREGTRAAGPFTAIWYLVFMLPFALWVRETPGPRQPLRLGAAMSQLGRLLASLPRRPSLSAWLASSMLLRDALNALYAFGGVFAGTVLGWPVFLAGVFGVVSAVSATLVSWIGGRADRRWGPKPVIIACGAFVFSQASAAATAGNLAQATASRSLRPWPWRQSAGRMAGVSRFSSGAPKMAAVGTWASGCRTR